jgi:hypothetical protein
VTRVIISCQGEDASFIYKKLFLFNLFLCFFFFFFFFFFSQEVVIACVFLLIQVVTCVSVVFFPTTIKKNISCFEGTSVDQFLL